MEKTSVSPPKTHRAALQPIPLSDVANCAQRTRPSIKKKLHIEQENYDYSNFPLYNQNSKYEFFSKKPTIQYDPLISKIALMTIKQKEISSLPYEVYIEILKFLSPEEIIRTTQYISKYWHKASNDRRLWGILDQSQKLSFNIKYQKQMCIVERRSRGRLYKAISRVTKQPVLTRTINLAVANGGHDDGIPTSVLREISYLSNLQHNNVARILEVEINNEIIQICSEYLDYNLREYNKQFITTKKNERVRTHSSRSLYNPNTTEYKMPLKNIKLISYQILKGLNYLHHQGIIHRNLKGDNILVNAAGIAKIHDFALSKLVAIPHVPYTPEDPKDRERSGREARRLWYRAPELLLRKKRYSFETDIWAFGCLLAEIAVNEPLFNGDTEIEQLFKVFTLIGSPNASNWSSICDDDQFKLSFPNWEAIYFPYVCYHFDTPEFKQVYKALFPNREKAFHKLQSLGKVLGESGLDLLWNCLSLNPQLRSSANTLLNHPFFDDIREEIEPNYTHTPQCMNDICKFAGNYNVPMSPDCHLISYFNTIKANELEMRPCQNFLEHQTALTEHMRSILVDWLIDVSVHFDFLDETLHLSVNYIDRTLSKIKLDKSKLQLVGVTCLKIADVFHERSKEYYKQDNAKEYAYITADEYNPQQLVDMEKEILNMLNFKLVAPNTMHFLKIYIGLFQIPENVAVIAQFLADLMLLTVQIFEFNYSLIASAALFLACMTTNYKIDEKLMSEYKQFLNVFKMEEFRKCVATIKDIWFTMLNTTAFANFDAIYNKYQTKYSFNGKALNPPTYMLQDIQNWFYSK